MTSEERVKTYRLDELMEVLSACEADIDKKVKQKKIKGQNDYVAFLLFSVNGIFEIVREAIALCSEGYAKGVVASGRSAVERFLAVAYFKSICGEPGFGRRVSQYYMSIELQQNRRLQYVAKCKRDIENFVEDNGATQESEKTELLNNMVWRFSENSLDQFWWIEDFGSNFSEYHWVDSMKTGFDNICEHVSIYDPDIRNIIREAYQQYKISGLNLRDEVDTGNSQWRALYLLAVSMGYIIDSVFKEIQVKNYKAFKHLKWLKIVYQNGYRSTQP